MNITRNVIIDLLPVYLSGESSPDTKTLIEEFLRQNPEFSNQVEEQRREFSAQHHLLRAAGAPSADHELRTLALTRSWIERQKWSLGLALAFTLFPLSFVFDGSHLTFMLVRDQPIVAVISWSVAAVAWIQHFVTRRRLRVKGL
jgi:hypothetical protein